MRDKDDYLLLSQLTHAGYCLRRCALVMNEQLWQESADTVKGHQEHERVHERRIERRGDSVRLYEHEVWSDVLKVRGKCDCIEAAADGQGVYIPAAEFPVRLYPVEFKHGKLRAETEYELQLCAQAMCLEEMYHTQIPEGAVFYTSSHRRHPVKLDENLRKQVRNLAVTLWDLRSSGKVPPAEYGAKCGKCSLKDQCLPRAARSARTYCEKMICEAEGVDAL